MTQHEQNQIEATEDSYRSIRASVIGVSRSNFNIVVLPLFIEIKEDLQFLAENWKLLKEKGKSRLESIIIEIKNLMGEFDRLIRVWLESDGADGELVK